MIDRPHALFVEYEAADGSVDSPEVFPRPDGTTDVCGLSSGAALPCTLCSFARVISSRARFTAIANYPIFAPRSARRSRRTERWQRLSSSQ